jgi:hypothetical protein
MAGDESDRQPSFKVQDRRRFSATGETRENVGDGGSEAAPANDQTLPPDAGAASASADMIGDEITFGSFVFSLSTQALVNLGEVPDPIDGATRLNLDGARQIIDILALLGEKTRGNLDQAESVLLENALYDLRMRYVERARAR